MKRIVFFSGYYLPFLGGIERYTDKLAHALKRLGYEVVIVTSNHNNLPMVQRVDGITIYRLPVLKFFKYRYPIPRLGRETRGILRTLMQNEKPDYVICNTRFQLTTLIGARWARRNGVRPLVIEHGSSHFSIGISALDWLGVIYEHILTRLVRHYVKDFYGVSRRCVEWLGHYNIKAKGVFYNAVDADTARDFQDKKYRGEWSDDAVIISYAGRVMKEKGVEMLLEAYKSIARHYTDTALLIAGDGPYLKEAIAKYGNEKQIFFVGKLNYEELMSLLNSTDIFCYPSMYPEGLPTSILEAGIMGCALIATDRGGTIEVVNDRKYGIIINEDKVALEEALMSLLGDRKYMKRLQDNASKRIKQQFTWDKTARTVQGVLEGKE